MKRKEEVMFEEIIIDDRESFQERLWFLKTAKDFCDVVVIVNGVRIDVHAVILAAASEYFRKEFGVRALKEVAFDNVDTDTLELLIKYCYTGTITITERNARDLLTLAKILSFDDIMETSFEILEKRIVIKNPPSAYLSDRMENLGKMIKEGNSSLDNTLMAIGADDFERSKTIEIFDLVKQNWIELDDFHYNWEEFDILAIDDKLLFIGGHLNGTSVNIISCYYLKSRIFESFPSMKHSRHFTSTVQYKGLIYVIGGLNENIQLPYVEKLDATSRKWMDAAPLIEARYGCGVEVVGDEIFVFGGIGINGYLNTTEAFNWIINKWRRCSPMNEERFTPGVGVLGGFLYAVGGCNANIEFLNTIERYDPQIDRWSLIKSLNIGRNLSQAGYLNGKLVIVGGKSETGDLSTVEFYEEESDEWKPMEHLNNPRSMFKLVQVPWNTAEDVLSRNKF